MSALRVLIGVAVLAVPIGIVAVRRYAAPRPVVAPPVTKNSAVRIASDDPEFPVAYELALDPTEMRDEMVLSFILDRQAPERNLRAVVEPATPFHTMGTSLDAHTDVFRVCWENEPMTGASGTKVRLFSRHEVGIDVVFLNRRPWSGNPCIRPDPIE